MKKFILTTAILAASISANADVITCNFGSTPVKSVYSMTKSTLTYIDLQTNQVINDFKNVSFQIKSPGQFELVAKNKMVLQKLSLNFKGNNGSNDDLKYPYDLEDNGLYESKKEYAGCESNFLKAKY